MFPDGVKNLNLKVFIIMSRTNETRHIECHKICKCKCRLDASNCNNNNVGMMINASVNANN